MKLQKKHKKRNMGNTYKPILLTFILFLFIISYISAGTLALDIGTIINATGLNTTLHVDRFQLTFNAVNITNNSVTFYNLSYSHPLSCNAVTTFVSLYNYTQRNKNDSVYNFPSTSSCGGSGGGGGGGGTPSSNCQLVYDFILAHYNSTNGQLNYTDSEFENLLSSTGLTSSELINHLNHYSLLCSEYQTLPFIDYNPGILVVDAEKDFNSEKGSTDSQSFSEGFKRFVDNVKENIGIILVIVLVVGGLIYLIDRFI